jgi:transposase
VGRPIIPYRKVLDGMLYVLRTGCQWKMLPKELIKRGYVLHIPTKKEKKRKVMNKNQKPKALPNRKKYYPKRWVVERTNSWHKRFRKLFTRYEKKDEN